MKRLILALGVTMLVAFPAFAAETTSTTTTTTNMAMGLDFSMPYLLKADGDTVNERGNFNIGVDGRYYMTENWNLGARLNFDVEEKTGTNRQYALAPGAQYHWMPTETWDPYVRFDVPVILKGAVNPTGSSSKQDVGISGGLGLAWNLGKSLGVENMSMRYDFNFAYMFGMGDSVDILSMEFFKIGFDYRF